jgi:3-deoxy-D-manno-octulosonic-acid transferase
MKKVYFFLTFLLNYFLYFFLFIRVLRKKESATRFREKLSITNANRDGGFLMWFHCSSIGELKSIFPIIDHYIKKNKILVTTFTLSSSEVFYKKYSDNKNIIHQFAPIDSPQIIKKFFLKWKPNIIFFAES